MDTEQSFLTRESERRAFHRLSRSELGNALLVLNLAYIVRGFLMAWAMFPAPMGCRFYYYWMYANEFTITSPVYALYNLVHAPTWCVLGILEWVLRPVLYAMDADIIHGLEHAGFVLVSSLQWLVVGHAMEIQVLGRELLFREPVPLSIAPKRLHRSAHT